LVSLAEEQEFRLLSTLPEGLHRGEAACLAIAHQRGWLLLSDDRAAHAEARRQGVRLSGSIGCLALAVGRGLASIEQADAWLEAMIAQGYRSPITDLASLIRSDASGSGEAGM